MVELVFVHGVATRPGRGYDTMVANRDALLKRVLFAGNNVTISSPMWGIHAAKLAWGGAAFQRSSDIIAPMDASDTPISGVTFSDVAALSPASGIDELFATMVDMANEQGRELDDQELEQFAAAARFLESGGMVTATADMPEPKFVNVLMDDMGVAAGLIPDSIKDAAKRITDRARNVIGKQLVALLRDRLNPAVAIFLGDVFAYLRHGDMRDKIRATVITQLLGAHDRAKRNCSKLILMGHSLGGVILYDLLSSRRLAGLPDDFHVDALITVGSQPGLFEELTLFDHIAAQRGPDHQVAGPACVELWLNIFDPIDLFAFKTAPVFAEAADFMFDSGTGLLDAHTTYFSRPQFHARLRWQLADKKLIAA